MVLLYPKNVQQLSGVPKSDSLLVLSNSLDS